MSLELLTLKEAAAKARVGLSTLNVMLARGEGPALTRIGGRVFVRADRFDAWVEERTEVGRGPAPSMPDSGSAMLAHAQGRTRPVEAHAL